MQQQEERAKRLLTNSLIELYKQDSAIIDKLFDLRVSYYKGFIKILISSDKPENSLIQFSRGYLALSRFLDEEGRDYAKEIINLGDETDEANEVIKAWEVFAPRIIAVQKQLVVGDRNIIIKVEKPPSWLLLSSI